MNNAPLACVHRAEKKRQAGRTDTISRVSCHGAKFRLAHRAEAVNVADEALAFREAARERLIDEVFECVEKFPALAPQQQRVRTVYIQNASALALVGFGAKVEARGAKDVV